MRKLLVASLDIIRAKDTPISLGTASIVANLISKKLPVSYKTWNLNNVFSPQKTIDWAMSHRDVDFAIGAFVWNEVYVSKIINGLKQGGFKGNIIVGGPQISYVSSGLEELYPNADIFIRGYGEHALADLMIGKNGIAGVHYKGMPDLGIIAKADLSDLPSPFLNGLIKPQPFIRWETQRGCPFRCTFCQHRSPNGLKRENFQMDRIIQEIDWICNNNVVDVAVLDPTFNSGPDYMRILDELASRFLS